MIRRIRELAETLGEDLAGEMQSDVSFAGVEGEIAEEDRELDVLVKHAMRGTHWLEHDPKRVWQRLSERVRGPFGSMAVEEPANIGSEMPLPQDHAGAEPYDAPSDARRHSVIRLSELAYPVR
jgi:hypothetical protein